MNVFCRTIPYPRHAEAHITRDGRTRPDLHLAIRRTLAGDLKHDPVHFNCAIRIEIDENRMVDVSRDRQFCDAGKLLPSVPATAFHGVDVLYVACHQEQVPALSHPQLHVGRTCHRVRGKALPSRTNFVKQLPLTGKPITFKHFFKATLSSRVVPSHAPHFEIDLRNRCRRLRPPSLHLLVTFLSLEKTQDETTQFVRPFAK